MHNNLLKISLISFHKHTLHYSIIFFSKERIRRMVLMSLKSNFEINKFRVSPTDLRLFVRAVALKTLFSFLKSFKFVFSTVQKKPVGGGLVSMILYNSLLYVYKYRHTVVEFKRERME